MATLDFGSDIKTSDDYVKEIQELLGVNPPITLVVSNDGVLKKLTVETQWTEGGTTPVEKEIEVEKVILVDDIRIDEIEVQMQDQDGQPIVLPDGSNAKEKKTVEVPTVREEKVKTIEMQVVDYLEEYEDKELTQKQKDDLNAYVAENIVL